MNFKITNEFSCELSAVFNLQNSDFRSFNLDENWNENGKNCLLGFFFFSLFVQVMICFTEAITKLR
jgi:hypothetical protein